MGDEGDEDGDEAAAGAFVSSSFKSRDFRFSCSCRMNTLEPGLAQPGCGAAAGGVFAAHPSWAAAAGGAVAAGGVVGRPSPPT